MEFVFAARSRRWVIIATTLALIATLGLVTAPEADAAKPDADANFQVLGITVVDTADGCKATIHWEGFRGGKPVFVEFRLVRDLGAIFTQDLQTIKSGRGNSGVLSVNGDPWGQRGFGAATAEFTTFPFGSGGNHDVHIRVFDNNGDTMYQNGDQNTDPVFTAASYNGGNLYNCG